MKTDSKCFKQSNCMGRDPSLCQRVGILQALVLPKFLTTPLPGTCLRVQVYGSPGPQLVTVLMLTGFCSSQHQAGGKWSMSWRTKLPFLRGLHRLEAWAHRNLMKFNKGKPKHPVWGSPGQGKHCHSGVSPAGATKMGWGESRQAENWVSSALRKRLRGDVIAVYNCLMGGYGKDGAKLFSKFPLWPSVPLLSVGHVGMFVRPFKSRMAFTVFSWACLALMCTGWEMSRDLPSPSRQHGQRKLPGPSLPKPPEDNMRSSKKESPHENAGMSGFMSKLLSGSLLVLRPKKPHL
ncbi:hypothetical protein QYF61_026480 [Mycteria americana]|uniref:Uncharacterized protein n=1 Tax=Mycteria americana TaxID=33587 RepID=A0AAN7RQR7_MYCAM|nr:hypothetical protein QYF61_026480 [Mycteria americana]